MPFFQKWGMAKSRPLPPLPGEEDRRSELERLEDEVLEEEVLRCAREYMARSLSTGITDRSVNKAAHRLEALVRRESSYTYRNQLYTPGEMTPLGILLPALPSSKIDEMREFCSNCTR